MTSFDLDDVGLGSPNLHHKEFLCGPTHPPSFVFLAFLGADEAQLPRRPLRWEGAERRQNRYCSVLRSADRTAAVTWWSGHATDTRGKEIQTSGGAAALLLLLTTAVFHNSEMLSPALKTVTSVTIYKTRWFHSRVRYYPNSDAAFNPSRLILRSGDVSGNPGPSSETGSRHQLSI